MEPSPPAQAPPRPMATVCRSCAWLGAGSWTRCPRCGGAALVGHRELASLTIAHLDCDAFYAAIEKRDDPSLAAKPVIVGGGKRGVVSTCCYLARAFGVRSAMPMFKALQLCPHAVVVKPRMSVYAREGRRVLEKMAALTPLVQPLSIDEALMDLAGLERLHGRTSAQSLARLQNEVEHEIGITVSIGLSFNRFLAKLACDFEKPRGFSVIGRAEALDVLAPLAPSVLPGVGKVGAQTLAQAGFQSVLDVRRAGREALAARFGGWGAGLFAFSMAEDPSPVAPGGAAKSISAETTFIDDITAPEALKDALWALCERVAGRARAQQVSGRTITLKLKDKAFKVMTKRRTLETSTRLARTLFDHGCALLAPHVQARAAYRLIGLSLSDLQDADGADRGDLMDLVSPKRAAREDAIALAREKFGPSAVRTGRAVKSGD